MNLVRSSMHLIANKPKIFEKTNIFHPDNSSTIEVLSLQMAVE